MSDNSNNSSRQAFGHVQSHVQMPDLLAIQINSYEEFLQEDVLVEKRRNQGLEQVFSSMFPVEDTHKNYVLEYKYYYSGLPKYTVQECLERRISYAVPLKVRFVLHITDENDRSKYVQDIEQDVFFGNIPYMTDRGTFVINGAERVIVSQLQRSPGVFFDEAFHPNGTKIFKARVIPFRGSWVDFTTDIYDCIYTIIDRRRKFPCSLLMRAIGYSSNRDIFEALGYVENVKKFNSKNIIERTLAEDLVDKKNGEVVREAGSKLNKSDCDLIMKMDLKQLSLIKKDVHGIEIEMLMNTFKKDPTSSTDEALLLLYQHLRTGEAPSIDISRKFIEKMFFSTKKYDLGQVGRYRINKKFDLDAPVDEPVLIKDDFVDFKLSSNPANLPIAPFRVEAKPDIGCDKPLKSFAYKSSLLGKLAIFSNSTPSNRLPSNNIPNTSKFSFSLANFLITLAGAEASSNEYAIAT